MSETAETQATTQTDATGEVDVEAAVQQAQADLEAAGTPWNVDDGDAEPAAKADDAAAAEAGKPKPDADAKAKDDEESGEKADGEKADEGEGEEDADERDANQSAINREMARARKAIKARELKSLEAIEQREVKLSAREADIARREAEAANRATTLRSMPISHIMRDIAKERGMDLPTFIKTGLHEIATGQIEPATAAPKESKEVSKLRAELDEIKSSASKQQADAARSAFLGGILSEAKSNTSAYPLTSVYSDEEVSNAAWSVSEEYYSATGKVPDAAMVLEHLEHEERKLHEARMSRLGSASGGEKPESEPDGEAGPAGEDRRDATGSVKAESQTTRTITNKSAAQTREAKRDLTESDFDSEQDWVAYVSKQVFGDSLTG